MVQVRKGKGQKTHILCRVKCLYWPLTYTHQTHESAEHQTPHKTQVNEHRGQDCLRIHANQCSAKHPEHLRSTQLTKPVATLSQVLNLKNNKLDQVADFLGHDIRVHWDFYRLPVPTTQLAKISKLLLSMEKGHLSSQQGRSLDETEL